MIIEGAKSRLHTENLSHSWRCKYVMFGARLLPKIGMVGLKIGIFGVRPTSA